MAHERKRKPPAAKQTTDAKTRQISDELLKRHGFLKMYEELAEKRRMTDAECAEHLWLRDWVAKVVRGRRLTKNQKGEVPSPRERLKKARAHAAKLLEYGARRGADMRTPHADSIFKRSTSLREALSSLEAVLWLANAPRPFDVPKFLNRLPAVRLQVDGLNRSQLTAFVRAVDSIPPAKRTGRPLGETMRVVRGGCIAWLRADRTESFTWREDSQRLTGPLPQFVRDLLSHCKLNMSDNALHYALRVALPYCKSSLRRRVP